MPSMSHFAYFAPLVASDDEVWLYWQSIHENIAEFADVYTDIGLRRGVHFSLTALPIADITELLAGNHKYECRIPLVEIGFRSKKYLDLARSGGIVQDANGDETESPIWG